MSEVISKKQGLFKHGASIDVFEYKDFFWIMETSSQIWPEIGIANQKVALAGLLPVNCKPAELGEICYNALRNYNSKKPQYAAWEEPELRRLWASWVKVRGWNSFLRDCRHMQAFYNEKSTLQLAPTDNGNILKLFMTIMREHIIDLTGDITPELLGKYVLQTMSHATWDPNKKTAKQKK